MNANYFFSSSFLLRPLMGIVILIGSSHLVLADDAPVTVNEIVNETVDEPASEIAAPVKPPEPSPQDLFWSAMAQKNYQEAGQHLEALLAQDSKNQNYKFQKAEWLWLSDSPRASIEWLSTEENNLNKNEIVNFINKMYSRTDQSDLEEIFTSLNEHGEDGFSVAEATLLVKTLAPQPDGKSQFLLHRKNLLKNFDQYPDSLEFDIAAMVEQYESVNAADKLYQMVILKNPLNIHALERIGRIYLKQMRYNDTRKIIQDGLKADSKSYSILMLEGELLEQTRDFLPAVQVYNHVLEIYPSNQAAFNVKMRALMDLGAHSLALDQISANPQSDPVLHQRSRGNMAMSYIRWEEPKTALTALTEKTLKRKDDYAVAKKNYASFDPKSAKVEDTRNRWDRILALSQTEQFDQVIFEYEQAVDDGVEIPTWIVEAAADAYLYNRQPKKALSMYQSSLNKQSSSYKTKMAVYYTYVDLGQFNQAAKLLEAMDLLEPVQVKERGILTDNARKEEIAQNKVWLLMYQDRLKKAQKIGMQYLKVAPASIQLRSSMAHLALWRGWPRQALHRFRMIQTMDPTYVQASIGYARALYDNMYKKEARAFIRELYHQHPNNRHVKRAKHLIEVDDMGLLTLNAYYLTEFPGEDEFGLSLRVDEPVTDHNQLFAQLIRRETTQTGTNDLTERFYVGDIYQPNMTWKLTGALSGDYRSGNKIGAIAGVEYMPDDFWTYAFDYDSHSIDVPLRSRAEGIDVQDYKLSARYRRHESFNTSWSVDLKDFEDSNQNLNYAWSTDSAVWTYAYWKWRMGTELAYATYSKQDVNYYSPEAVYAFYLIPNVEHTWYRRYEKAVVDRFFVGVGQQWQKNFSAADVGFLRYEIEYRHSDTFSVLFGTIYALRNYDNDDVNSLNVYGTLRKRF